MIVKEVIMKLKLLSVALVLFMVQLSSEAAISVEQTMSPEYLLNNGYSKQIYDSIQVTRARALGEKYYSSEEIADQNREKKFRILKKIQAYIDPAVDDYSFYHHDISPEPSYKDF
jgi:hypothetical protein